MAKMDDEAVERRLKREAAEEEAAKALEHFAGTDKDVADYLDNDLREGFEQMMNMPFDKLQKELRRELGISAKEAQEAIDTAALARAAASGGWLYKGNPKNAAKILQKNKNLRKLAKKKSGCFGVLAILAGTAVSLLWGTIALAQHIVEAIGR